MRETNTEPLAAEWRLERPVSEETRCIRFEGLKKLPRQESCGRITNGTLIHTPPHRNIFLHVKMKGMEREKGTEREKYTELKDIM